MLGTIPNRPLRERNNPVHARVGRRSAASTRSPGADDPRVRSWVRPGALVIGYVPVLYQAFSRREVSVALLDARAGSPPTAVELLRRHGFEGGHEALSELLAEWERWSAEILESHISYPILCYYRSQHDNQSWLSALVAILDSCALLISIVEGSVRAAGPAHLRDRAACPGRPGARLPPGAARKAGGRDRPPPTARIYPAMQNPRRHQPARCAVIRASATRLHAIRSLYEPHAIRAVRVSADAAANLDSGAAGQGPVAHHRPAARAGRGRLSSSGHAAAHDHRRSSALQKIT